MAGKHDANLRSGGLAEGIGREILRRFSAVAPVPREEDIGVDAMCTLLRRQDARTLYAENSFGVQFKANSLREIAYVDHEARWLRELDIPLLIGSVDVENPSLELYSTENVHARYVHEGIRIDYVLCLDGPGRVPDTHRCGLYDLPRKDPHVFRLWLGTPLLSCTMLEAAARDFARRAYDRLKPWLDFSADSRRLRSYDVHREASLDGSSPPTAMSYDTASKTGDIDRLLNAMDPLHWRLGSLLGHSFDEGPLLQELRGIRQFMRKRGITPLGFWEDPVVEETPAPNESAKLRTGRVLVNWVGEQPATPDFPDPKK